MPPTQDEIDAAAADAAATAAAADEHAAEEEIAAQPPTSAPKYPVLVIGSEGEDVTKLINLLILTGQANETTRQKAADEAQHFDEELLANVKAAQAKLGVGDEAAAGQDTWVALYQAAGEKMQPPASEAGIPLSAAAAPADAPSADAPPASSELGA